MGCTRPFTFSLALYLWAVCYLMIIVVSLRNSFPMSLFILSMLNAPIQKLACAPSTSFSAAASQPLVQHVPKLRIFLVPIFVMHPNVSVIVSRISLQ